MEDMERKNFLQETDIHFAKKFKAKNSNGKSLKKLQTIGTSGKSPRLATCFIHIVSDEDEYCKNEEAYLKNILDPLIKHMNEKVSERQIQYESLTFKLPRGGSILETATTESLANILEKEECLDLFAFVYDKEVKEYADIDTLLQDFPHIPNEFLGSNTEADITTLKGAR